MKIEKSSMSESEWIRFQSLEVSRKNVNEGLGLLLMFVAGVLLLAVVFNVNIPLLLVGVITVVIFCFKQLKNMFENGRSYFVHRESKTESKANITSPFFERDSLESNDIPVIASPSAPEKLEDIIVMDEEVERVKGNRGVSVNSEGNDALEDIQTLESSFAEIPVIDCENDAVVFDETFSPNTDL